MFQRGILKNANVEKPKKNVSWANDENLAQVKSYDPSESIEDWVAEQNWDDEEAWQKNMAWIGLSIGAFGAGAYQLMLRPSFFPSDAMSKFGMGGILVVAVMKGVSSYKKAVEDSVIERSVEASQVHDSDSLPHYDIDISHELILQQKMFSY